MAGVCQTLNSASNCLITYPTASSKFPNLSPEGMSCTGAISSKNISIFAPVSMRICLGLSPVELSTLNPEEVVFVAENVTGKPLHTNDPKPFSKGVKMILARSSSGIRCDDTQSPMSIEPGEVMHIFEGIGESSIRMTHRFFSHARLYRLKPIPELLWEWKLLESALLEIPISTVEHGKLYAACIGGRFGLFE